VFGGSARRLTREHDYDPATLKKEKKKKSQMIKWRSENPSHTSFEFWPFPFSSFLPSQNHSFIHSPFMRPAAAVTTHDVSPASAFTRRPSHFSSPVHGHGLDAIADLRWASQFTLVFFKRR
jgi:hypothetical protein